MDHESLPLPDDEIAFPPDDGDDALYPEDREIYSDPPTLPYIGPMGVRLDANYLLGFAMGAPDLGISSHDVLRCPDISPKTH